MKNLVKIVLISLLSLVGVTSCSESDEHSEYADWTLRNSQYIDSIANEAAQNSTGEWKRFLATGLNASLEWGNEYYVYCKVVNEGTGVEHPMFNDNVWLNYKGSLINGTIFDASYSGELDPEYEAPVETPLNECVIGFSTAVQEMVKDDVWEVYIPANLGYGSTDYGSIRAYSTLIFTINLVDFSHPVSNK